MTLFSPIYKVGTWGEYVIVKKRGWGYNLSDLGGKYIPLQSYLVVRVGR